VTVEIVVPRVGEAVSELTLAKWLKNQGDPVRKGDLLFELDVEKAVLEVEAFADGTLAQILVPAGSAVMPQQVVGLLAPADEEVVSPKATADVGGTPCPAQGEMAIKVSPTARRIAAELGVSLEGLEGSGPGKRVTAEDVREFAARQSKKATVPASSGSSASRRASPRARRLAQELGVDLSALVGTGVGGLISAKDVQGAAEFAQGAPAAPTVVQPLSKLRRAIAVRMQASKREVPHFYLMLDVDMTQVERLRTYCREELNWDRAPSYTDIVVRACALALAATPSVNVSYAEGGLAPRRNVDIGIAVAVDDGLIVPVLALADQLDLRQTSEHVRELAERARKGRLSGADLSEKSMVVSNLGMYGVDAFIAIIDIPDPVILAVGRVAERVVPFRGKPAIRPMCTLTLSVDHRVLDGVMGAQFLTRVREHLENAFGLVRKAV